MRASRMEGRSWKKTMLAAAVVIGASTALFQGFTVAATNTASHKTTKVPTSYASYTLVSSQTTQQRLPAGYKKANYTVGDINLEYYRNQTPAAKDMSKEEAAEIGAQALWKVFGLHLEGQVIEMGYQQPTDGLPRSSWYADVLVNGKRSYSFSVDSVTGEVFDLARSRKLDKKVSVAFDAALAKNPKDYEALAEKLAEKHNVVHSTVKSVAYNGQGYSDNDPTISIDIQGENGEWALMSFSRYDQALLGVVYNTEYKSSLEAQEKLVAEMQEKAKALAQSSPSPAKKGEPFLSALQ